MVQRKLRSLDLGSGFCTSRRSRERVKRSGGEHLRRGHGEVQRHNRRSVEFVEIESRNVVVRVCEDFVALRRYISMQSWRMNGCAVDSLTSNISEVLYLVYTEFSYKQGSEYNCRPSTAIGTIVNEPLACLVKLPCCHCIIPFGHLGLFAVAMCQHITSPVSAVWVRSV